MFLVSYHLLSRYGEVSEWFKELVLKTSDAKAPRVRISASPPPFKNSILIEVYCPIRRAVTHTEKYSRGRRGAPAKGVGRATGARVQISPSPPNKKDTARYLFCLRKRI